jgi:hypothetical protein
MSKKKPALGSGARFKSLEEKVKKEGYSEKSAAAIAASAGRKAHGQKSMEKYSKMGKKK